MQTMAEYMRMIPPHAPAFSGEPNTTTFVEWKRMTLAWMRSLRVSDRFRIGLAQTLLKGPALRHWTEREEQFGHETDWNVFVENMTTTFRRVDAMTSWTRKANRFYQLDGESIRSYAIRFHHKIVMTYPVFDNNELLHMQIFSRGVHPYFRPPHPHPPFRTVSSMIRAYTEYADRSYPPTPCPGKATPYFAQDPNGPSTSAPPQMDEFPNIPIHIKTSDDEDSNMDDSSDSE